MKKLLLILTVFMVSCTSKKKKIIPVTGEARIAAVYTRNDSSNVLDILWRIISKKIVFDSVSKKDKIVYDTVWGYPVNLPIRDSTGKPVIGADGKQKLHPLPTYLVISNDSVYTDIANKNVDSLLRKKGTYK